jgi:hypothetical protein
MNSYRVHSIKLDEIHAFVWCNQLEQIQTQQNIIENHKNVCFLFRSENNKE